MRTRRYANVTISGSEFIEVRNAGGGLALLDLVTVQEAEDLRAALLRGKIPVDFERKLSRLEGQGFMHQFIAQSCHLFALLLMAAYAGMFKDASERECDEILRALAYVRKDEDVIPDYTTNGFVDDLQGVRAVIGRLQNTLNRFKAWRLCHQVPAMWRN